jgi:hypothetical protein
MFVLSLLLLIWTALNYRLSEVIFPGMFSKSDPLGLENDGLERLLDINTGVDASRLLTIQQNSGRRYNTNKTGPQAGRAHPLNPRFVLITSARI